MKKMTTITSIVTLALPYLLNITNVPINSSIETFKFIIFLSKPLCFTDIIRSYGSSILFQSPGFTV